MANKKRISIMIDGDVLERVEELSGRVGASRSQVINQMCIDGVAAEDFTQRFLFNPESAREMLGKELQKAIGRVVKSAEVGKEGKSGKRKR